MTREEWNDAITKAYAEIDAEKDRTVPAPIQGEGEFHPHMMPVCNRIITRDMIRIYTTAIGDPNPLWVKEDYARNTRMGGIVAPPLCEIMIAESAPTPPPLPFEGLTEMNGGSTREYYAHIRPGDEFTAMDTFLGVTEKTNPEKPYRLFLLRSKREFFNMADELVVRVTANILHMARYPDGRAEKKLDFSDAKMRRYTDEELALIHAWYDDELAGKHRRGSAARFYEDVNIGDDMGSVFMGPYDLSDAVSFFGVTGYSQAFASKWQGIRKELDAIRRDPDTNEYSIQPIWHFNNANARMYNVPFAPIFGTHIECSFAHLATNWMGDDGELRQISSQIRRMAFLGDTLVIKGKIVGKREENGAYLVDVEMLAEQFGQDGVCSTAQATIALPHKAYATYFGR